MFYVYLLHDLNNIKLQEYIKKYIDIKQVRTIKQVVPHKITDINLETDVKSRLNWHIKDLDQHLLVVPTYARKAKIDKKEYSDESVVGYVRSRIFMLSVEDKLGSVPDLIVGKENLQQPCFFCSNYLEGFQTGACYFGGINCRIGCRIHLPDKNLVINLGEENV